MTTRPLTLLTYFTIKNLTAEEISINGNTLSALCTSNDYVIEKYVEDRASDGNFRYIYKIYNSRQQESPIKFGDWYIKDMISNMCFRPHLYISFKLFDVNNNTVGDRAMPYIKANSVHWKDQHVQDLLVGGSDVDSINRMLDLGKRASSFKSWYYFLENLSIQELKTKYLAKLQKVEQVLIDVQSAIDELKKDLK